MKRTSLESQLAGHQPEGRMLTLQFPLYFDKGLAAHLHEEPYIPLLRMVIPQSRRKRGLHLVLQY